MAKRQNAAQQIGCRTQSGEADRKTGNIIPAGE